MEKNKFGLRKLWLINFQRWEILIYLIFELIVVCIPLCLLYSLLTFAYVNCFCINYNSISPAIKTNKSRLCLTTNSTALPRKIEIALIKLPAAAYNASAVFPTYILGVSFTLFKYFLQGPFIFWTPKSSVETTRINVVQNVSIAK